MPSHQDLHCLPFCYTFLNETPISNNEHVQIQRWKSPCQKLGCERVRYYESPMKSYIYLIVEEWTETVMSAAMDLLN